MVVLFWIDVCIILDVGFLCLCDSDGFASNEVDELVEQKIDMRLCKCQIR